MSKKNKRKRNSQRNLTYNSNSELISNVNIMHPDMTVEVSMYQDNSVSMKLKGMEKINQEKVLESLRNRFQSSNEPVYPKQGELKIYGEEGNYSLEILSYKGTLSDSLKHSAETLHSIKSGIPVLDNNIIGLLSNLEPDKVKMLSGTELIPLDVIKYTKDKETVFYKRSGYFMNVESMFVQACTRQFEKKDKTKGKIDIFEKGIPSELLDDLLDEIDDFEKRGEAFFMEGRKYFESENFENSLDNQISAFYDHERARIIQTFIIDNEKTDDIREDISYDSRINLAEILQVQCECLDEITKITGNYDLLRRFIDRNITKVEKILDEINDKHKKSKFNLKDEEGYFDYEMTNRIKDVNSVLDHLRIYRQDVDKVEHIALCEESVYKPSSFSPLELSLVERLAYYQTINDPKKVIITQNVIKKRMLLDPLYLKTLPHFPF